MDIVESSVSLQIAALEYVAFLCRLADTVFATWLVMQSFDANRHSFDFMNLRHVAETLLPQHHRNPGLRLHRHIHIDAVYRVCPIWRLAFP
jgi:hypothetical protein